MRRSISLLLLVRLQFFPQMMLFSTDFNWLSRIRDGDFFEA